MWAYCRTNGDDLIGVNCVVLDDVASILSLIVVLRIVDDVVFVSVGANVHASATNNTEHVVDDDDVPAMAMARTTATRYRRNICDCVVFSPIVDLFVFVFIFVVR